jgi:hypothetical protein
MVEILRGSVICDDLATQGYCRGEEYWYFSLSSYHTYSCDFSLAQMRRNLALSEAKGLRCVAPVVTQPGIAELSRIFPSAFSR